MFDEMSSDDLILAFFPCTRFEENILLSFRGDQNGVNKWDDEKKVENSKRLFKELAEYYDVFCEMVLIALQRGLRMIIENPYSTKHALFTYFPIKAKVIDKDRSKHGDYFKKPTQYWYINCDPPVDLKPFVMYPGPKTSVNEYKVEHLGLPITVARSMISPEYASYFVDHYLIDLVKEGKLV